MRELFGGNVKKAMSWGRNNVVIFQNMSYITILQIFIVVSPLITYPYLTKVLGTELYGLIITSQVLASYATIFINFGSDKICAKHVAIFQGDKDKQSEVLCSVFFARVLFWIFSLCVYMVVVLIVPSYREYAIMFFIAYGITFNDLFFPQYFFQGIEKMKYSTLISIGTRSMFIILIFFVVKTPFDYLYVPILYTLGSFVSGIASAFIIFYNMKYKFYIPKIKTCLWYVKDSSPMFAVDLILTIKDKLNVLFLGLIVGMSNVVVYDLGTKINSFVNKPNEIICTVMLPRFSRERNVHKFIIVLGLIFIIVVAGIIAVNIFLPEIVNLFIHDDIDLLPLRVFSIAPLFLSISSCIAYNLLVAFGYNKYMLYSIIVATIAYVFSIGFMFFVGFLNNLLGFVIVSLAAYLVELIYRVYIAKKVVNQEAHKRYSLKVSN